MEKQLAHITDATLEIRERGILNFWIYVDYEEGSSQGVGGLALDEYDPETKERVGTAYGCEMIRQLLITLDVNDLKDAAGKMIWVIGEGAGFDFKPKGIKQLRKDGGRELVFADVYNRFMEGY